MLPRPSIVCRVMRPMAFPIPAHTGDVLAVWPDHPTHALAVLTADCAAIIRHAPYDAGKLYGDLLGAFLDGKLQLPEPSQRALLSRSA